MCGATVSDDDRVAGWTPGSEGLVDINSQVCSKAVFINRRRLTPGTEVSVFGKRGRFRFVSASVTSEGRLVLNFVGGKANRVMMRSFYPEQIKRVHRLNATRENWKEVDQNE